VNPAIALYISIMGTPPPPPNDPRRVRLRALDRLLEQLEELLLAAAPRAGWPSKRTRASLPVYAPRRLLHQLGAMGVPAAAGTPVDELIELVFEAQSELVQVVPT